jgi:hypothetical protein
MSDVTNRRRTKRDEHKTEDKWYNTNPDVRVSLEDSVLGKRITLRYMLKKQGVRTGSFWHWETAQW